MKNLKDCFVNEARQLEYRVTLVGCDNPNKDDQPVSVTILVDPSDADPFEEFLEREQDNAFAHVFGGRDRLEY